ncbi:MAG: OmpA family protein [Ignavibacteria bacterium]|nr:OmpA family protein [Ignavibacteria bacterium]
MRLAVILIFVIIGVAASAQKMQISPLDGNTQSDDFAPSPTAHGRTLIISSAQSGEQRLYSVDRTSSGWTDMDELSGSVNNGTQVGTASLTPDGQTMIFAAYGHDVSGQGRTDLYMAHRENGRWTNVANLGGSVNTANYESQPSITSDGRTLYFVSDRPGKGGTDIYVSTWMGKQWSAARPLDAVNSASDEMSPIIAPDGRTLSFASNKAGGLGGQDIYIGKINGMNVSDVKNVGSPINTAADELFYTSIANSNQAYFTRTSANGDYDNYLVVPNPFPGDEVTFVEGTVRDAITKEPLGADITVTDLTTGKSVASLRSDDETGQYYVTLTSGHQYSITARRPGYLFHSERYDVPPSAKGQTITKDIYLSPLTGGSGRLLVFFDYDKSELKTESYPDLERVIELMKEDGKIRMRFEGHTDDQGGSDYNMTLSKKRAEAVKAYIVNGGVDAKRVESVGYGETKPLMQAETEEAHSMNRRVEMHVIP